MVLVVLVVLVAEETQIWQILHQKLEVEMVEQEALVVLVVGEASVVQDVSQQSNCSCLSEM